MDLSRCGRTFCNVHDDKHDACHVLTSSTTVLTYISTSLARISTYSAVTPKDHPRRPPTSPSPCLRSTAYSHVEASSGITTTKVRSKSYCIARRDVNCTLDDVGLFSYGLGHPMKPHRMRMTHDLVAAYGMLPQMQIFVSGYALLCRPGS